MNRTSTIIAVAIIALFIIISYSNSIHVPFQFDDVKRISDVRIVQHLNLKDIFQYSKSRFLLYLTFSLNYYFGKYNAAGYHAVNAVIHIINSIFVYFLCTLIFNSPRLAGSRSRNHKNMFSFLSALIFALHPIQTESVTYIWQRGESLAGSFYFLSLITYAKFRLNQINAHKNDFYLYAICLLSIACASVTKPTSATLPAAIFLYEICFLSCTMKDFKRALRYITPILILIILPMLLAKYDIQESKNVGIKLSTDFLPYYYTKLRVLVRALWLLVLPINQTLEHDFTWSTSLIEPVSTLYSFIFLAGLIIAGILFFKRYSLVSFAIMWFYLTMSITTLLFLEDLFFEHYLYLPLFGYALLLPVLSFNIINNIGIKRRWLVVAFIILITCYSGATYTRNKAWHTEISLWEDAVRKSPRKARAHYTLGVYYFRAKRYGDALKEYKTALDYKPEYPEAYYRLGEYCFNAYDARASIENYKKAIAINPDFFEAYLNLGYVYFYEKDYKNARMCLEKALTLTKDMEYTNNIQAFIQRMVYYE